MWTTRNFAPGYVALLREARRALKSADRRAQVVLGGLTSSITWPRVWDALDAVYRAGGGGLFDFIALHPFTRTPSGVVEIIRRSRRVANRHGERRRPILVTEFSWTSRARRGRRGLATWEVSRAQQARNLTQAYRLLVHNRSSLRIAGAYWYSWLTTDTRPFWSYWAGLRTILRSRRIVSKPAHQAYQAAARRYQGCRKSAFANRCA
jgi:hypothetical protein